MLRRIAHCRRLIAAQNTHLWRQQIYSNPPTNHFLYNSSALFSFYSRKSSSSYKNYRRKRRKCSIQLHRAQCLQNFAFELAKQSFKQTIRKSKTSLLSDFTNSFATYEIEPTTESYQFLFKTLIQKQPSNWYEQIREILGHIEKVENFETPECVFIDLINFYGDKDMYNDAVDLFFGIPKYRCEPSVEVLNVLLSVLCRDKRGLEMVPGILIKSQMMNIRIEESSYTVLIRALCKIGKFNKAFELLGYMVEEGFDVDQRVCSLILETMCNQVDCDCGEIMGVLEDLRKLGFKPRKGDFCNVIRILIEKGKGKDGLRLLKEMKMNGVKPDVMCYNLVLDGLIQNGDFFSADKVFDELLVLGLVPDVYTYNMYISGLCVQNKVEDGMRMMGAMEELGCAPDSSTYDMILRALGMAGEVDRIREVVNEMRLKSMELSRQTYEIVINGFISNGDMNGACSLLDEMLGKDFAPPPTTLDRVICMLCESGSCFVAPGASSWQVLVEGCDLTFDVESFVNENQLQVEDLLFLKN